MALTTEKTSPIQPTDESILVVKRSDLFGTDSWHGIKTDQFDQFQSTIEKHKEFLPRAEMELNPTYKQIIPYLVFHHDNSYFLMQRSAVASEQRLKNQYTIGIGGHVRQEDLHAGESIFDWAKREFHEEVSYDHNLSIQPIGILNDDSNDVGKVHLGIILLLTGDSAQITIRSELKSGRLVTLDECDQYKSSMESWSAMVFEYLKSSQE